eukprot:gene6432-biopygen10415
MVGQPVTTQKSGGEGGGQNWGGLGVHTMLSGRRMAALDEVVHFHPEVVHFHGEPPSLMPADPDVKLGLVRKEPCPKRFPTAYKVVTDWRECSCPGGVGWGHRSEASE